MSGSAEPVVCAGSVLCVRCGYDLAGLGDIELCPECAAPVAVSREAASALGTPWQRGASAGSWFGSAWFGLRYGLDHLAQDLRPDRDWRLAAINAAAMVVLACVPAVGVGGAGLREAAWVLVQIVVAVVVVLAVFFAVAARVLARPMRRLRSSVARGICRAGLGHATQWLVVGMSALTVAAPVAIRLGWTGLGVLIVGTAVVCSVVMSLGMLLEVRQRLERLSERCEGESDG